MHEWMNDIYCIHIFLVPQVRIQGSPDLHVDRGSKERLKKKIKNCNFAMINRDNTYYHFRKWGFLLSDSGCLPPPPNLLRGSTKKMSSLLAHCAILNIKRSNYIKNYIINETTFLIIQKEGLFFAKCWINSNY